MNLSDMSWKQAGGAFEEDTIALIPVGSIENHGPHLPLGTDYFTALHIAERVSREGEWILVPPIPVGVSEHHRQFPGSLFVEPEVLRAYCLGICRSLSTHGIRKIVYVNGHGGNTAALNETIMTLRKENIHAFVFQWWDAVADLISEICELPHDHAGDMETSMILCLRPELVHEERFREAAADVSEWGRVIHGVQTAFDTVDFTPSGVVGNPEYATAAKGKRLYDASAGELFLFCEWLDKQGEETLSSQGAVGTKE